MGWTRSPESDTVARLVPIAYCMPPVKRLLWRARYELLAHRYRDRQWTFMNYGHRSSLEHVPLVLTPIEEPDRSCFELYHLIAGAVDPKGGMYWK